jgi:hypothetical protein
MSFAADFAGVDDLDIDAEVTGAAAVAEAVGRRITTKPGDVFYDPAYVCTDLGAWQSRAVTDADLYRLRVDLERCVRAERRVADFTCDVAFYAESFELRVVIDGVTVDGEAFNLTATVLPDEGVQLAIAA